MKREVGFEWEHLSVDAVEERHGFSPRKQTGDVTADALRSVHVVVLHLEVGLEELHHFVVDDVFGVVLELQEESGGGHHLG